MDLYHGREWTDGYYNFIAIQKQNSSFVIIDAEGVVYSVEDFEELLADGGDDDPVLTEVDKEMSGTDKIKRWVGTPNAAPLPI